MNGKRIAFAILKPVLSLAAGAISLITTSSFLPAGMMPEGTMSSLGPLQGLFGSVNDQAIGAVSSVFPIGNYLPLVAGGGSGFIVWMVVSRIIGKVQDMTNSSSAPTFNQNDMMRSIGSGLPFGATAKVPEKLPDDITKVQYTVLKLFHQGYKNPKDIAKQLSMDNKEVQKQWDALITSGYLTKDKKLTSKGIELVT